jgi:hypothetical protein
MKSLLAQILHRHAGESASADLIEAWRAWVLLLALLVCVVASLIVLPTVWAAKSVARVTKRIYDRLRVHPTT